MSPPVVLPAVQDDAAPPVQRNAWTEAIVVFGLALLAIVWVIPAQTTAGGAAVGLAPSTLPTVCAVAIAVLALINLVVIVARGRSQERGVQAVSESALPTAAGAPRSASPWQALKIILVSLAGVVALAYGGTRACAVVIVPLGMVTLGERRIWRILAVTLVALAPFVLLFR